MIATQSMVNVSFGIRGLELLKKGYTPQQVIDTLTASDEGRDIRGMQSAALVTYKGTFSGKPWDDKLVDIRVDDNPKPLVELKRLLKVYRAYEHMNNGDLAVEKNDINLAMQEYSAAEKMFPDNDEMKFWTAVSLFNKDKKEDSYKIFKQVFKMNPNYRILVPRVVNSKMLNATNEEIKHITGLK